MPKSVLCRISTVVESHGWKDRVVVKEAFRSLDIQCWEHTRSKLGFKTPFLCLQARSEACDILLHAIDELLGEEPPAKRSLTLKPCNRRHACIRIRLLLSPPSDELNEMSLTRSVDTATLEFTPVAMAKFKAAVLMWRDGGEDFSVHPSGQARGKKDRTSGEVWFWTPSTDP